MDKIIVGETIKEAFQRKKAELPKQEIIAKKIGLKSRSQLWNILQSNEMEPKYVIRLGELLGENFYDQFKDLVKYRQMSTVQEPEEKYTTVNDELKNELFVMQKKYIELLEENKRLQEELRKK